METNIYARVNAIKELFLGIQADARNDFSKYDYLTLTAINKILIPAEIERRLYHRISFTENMARLEIINIDDKNEIITVEKRLGTTSLTACHDAQNVGASETYARRYLLMAAFDIAAEDDLDSGQYGPPENRKGPQQQGRSPAGPPQGNREGPADPLEELKRSVWNEIKALPQAEQNDWVEAAATADEGELQRLLANLRENARARARQGASRQNLAEQWGPYPQHNPER